LPFQLLHHSLQHPYLLHDASCHSGTQAPAFPLAHLQQLLLLLEVQLHCRLICF
jgi:hypothetical protein